MNGEEVITKSSNENNEISIWNPHLSRKQHANIWLMNVQCVFLSIGTCKKILYIKKKKNTHTHIWLTYITVDTENYDSFTLVKSILVMVHIMHLWSGFSLQVLIMRLAHPSGLSYSMSFL